MTPRYATRNALLAYLGPEGATRIAIYRQMFAQGVSVPATREQLCRLVAAGVVEYADGWYRIRNDRD